MKLLLDVRIHPGEARETSVSGLPGPRNPPAAQCLPEPAADNHDGLDGAVLNVTPKMASICQETVAHSGVRARYRYGYQRPEIVRRWSYSNVAKCLKSATESYDILQVTPATGFWTFFFKPKTAYVHQLLAKNPQRVSHTICARKPEEFASGQMGVIRAGKDDRTRKDLKGDRKIQPGVYAIVEILGPAGERPSNGYEYYPPESELHDDQDRVCLQVLRNLVSEPVSVTRLRQAGVDDNYLLNPPQGKHCMPLSARTFELITQLLET